MQCLGRGSANAAAARGDTDGLGMNHGVPLLSRRMLLRLDLMDGPHQARMDPMVSVY